MSTEAAQVVVAAPASEPVVAAPAATTVETQTTPAPVTALPMESDAIDAFFRGEKSLDVPTNAIEGGATAAAEPVVQPVATPAGVTPPDKTTTAEPVTGKDDRIIPRKIPTDGIDDEGQRALSLQYALNKNGAVKPGDPGYISLSKALGQLDSHDVAVAAIPAAKPEPTRVEIVTAKVTYLKTKLQTLRDERKQMAESETFFGPDAESKTSEIEDAIHQLAIEESRLERETEAEAGRSAAEKQRTQTAELTAREKALATATEKFPGLRDPQTPLGAKADRIYKEMSRPGHPDHAMLHAVNAAGFIAQTAANELAEEMSKDGKVTYAEAYASLIKSAKAAPAPAAVPDNPLQPKISPAGGSATSVPAGGQPTVMNEQQLLAASLDDPSIIDEVLYTGRRPQWVIGQAGG